MKRYFFLSIFAAICCLAGCTSTTTRSQTPTLGGQAPYTTRVPSPSNYQATSAIKSSTMLPPVEQ